MKNNRIIIDVVTNQKKLYYNISQTLMPILESWSGKKLSPNPIIYGIRRYLRGARCALHVDQLPTHILSIILQVCANIIFKITAFSKKLRYLILYDK